MSSHHIAVLGGAFDPPTLGHQDIIEQCLERFDAVWLVPAYCHAFDKRMSPYTMRVEMAKAFVKDLGLPQLSLKACEDAIQTEGPVYSIDLMTYLKNNIAEKNDVLSLIIGPDNAALFDKFKESHRLKTAFSPYIVKERRTIRSTQVRKAIVQGKPIDNLVTPSVESYIKLNALYQRSTPLN